MTNYLPRIVDEELALRLQAIGAIVIVGPKWCGKTTTAKQQANSVLEMQDPDLQDGYLKLAETKPSLLLQGDKPRLLDEWQLAPVLWDAVRVSVDRAPEKGLYILTGSVVKDDTQTKHSGTGRISRLEMTTMTLFESGESSCFDNRTPLWTERKANSRSRNCFSPPAAAVGRRRSVRGETMQNFLWRRTMSTT